MHPSPPGGDASKDYRRSNNNCFVACQHEMIMIIVYVQIV